MLNIVSRFLLCLFTGCIFANVTWAATEDPSPVKAPKTVTELEAEIDRVAKLPGGKQIANSDQATLLFWINKIHLGITDAYSGEGDRYLAVQLMIGNRSAESVTIPSDEIRLQANAKTYETGVSRDDFETGPLRVEGEVRPLDLMKTPKKTTIPAGKVKTIWCLYFGLADMPRIPQMSLSVKLPQDKLNVIDITEMQHARLALTSQTLGPANCLRLFEIHGSLNTVNAAVLVNEIERAQQEKIERVIIEWKPEARAVDAQLVDWLIDSTSVEGRTNALYRESPNLPEMRQLLLANLPQISQEDLDYDGMAEHIFASADQAVTVALHDVFQRVDQAELMKSIRSDNILVAQAALYSGGHRLDSSALSHLEKLATSDNPALQKAALSALAYQGDKALPLLITAINDKNADLAEAGFVSLLNSQTSQGEQAVQNYLDGPFTTLSQVTILKLLQNNYRPAWNSFITSSLASESNQVRQTAYRILSEVGHPKIHDYLKKGLVDPDSEVRTHVFEVLAQRTDPSSQTLATQYALERLAAGELNDSIIGLISKTLDPRAAPLLYAQLEKETPYHTEIIQLLTEVGDNTIAQNLKGRFDTLDEDEQVAVLNMFSTLQLPGELELAKKSIKSESEQVQQCAIELLQEYDGDEAVDVLVDALTNADERMYLTCVMSLGRIGSERAKVALDKLRLEAVQEANDKHILAMAYAYRLIREKSPAADSMNAGDYHYGQEEMKEALKHYQLATEIDPELSTAWSSLGMIRLRLKEYEQSLKDYEIAFRLDPYDGQAITGLGIALSIQGNWEKGIEITEKAAKNFPTDNIYAYNTACVYGRALEAIAKSETPVDSNTIQEIRSKAISILKKSIELGFDEFTLMRTDPDLDALRDHPEFAPLHGGQ